MDNPLRHRSIVTGPKTSSAEGPAGQERGRLRVGGARHHRAVSAGGRQDPGRQANGREVGRSAKVDESANVRDSDADLGSQKSLDGDSGVVGETPGPIPRTQGRWLDRLADHDPPATAELGTDHRDGQHRDAEIER
jgi:hypothetical protein